jgi:hypothetical protein
MTALDDVMIRHAAHRGPVVFRLGPAWVYGTLLAWPVSDRAKAKVVHLGRHHRIPKTHVARYIEEAA